MTDIRNSILAGIAFGIMIWLFYLLVFAGRNAIYTGILSGIAFGTIIYFFVTSKTVNDQTKLTDQDGQTIINSGRANHFMEGEAVGGKLYLLNDTIKFQSHRFNIRNHQQTIVIKDIADVSFYNTLGLIPNGLVIYMKDGTSEKFVVNNRKLWKAKIDEQIQKNGINIK